LTIRDMDLESILYHQSNSFDPISLDFLTDRPPPFKPDDDRKTAKAGKKVSYEAKKAYTASFPQMERQQRNARSNPFQDVKYSDVRYGQGVRLYSMFK
ncbi:hypothetical protein HDU91_003885, partial [Kappamyces sp. JEL0680]